MSEHSTINMAERDAAADTPPSVASTTEAEQIDGVKTRLARLCARDDELTAAIERAIAERKAVRAEMASVKDELDALVNTPVRGGHDPTLWLPSELMEKIFLMIPVEVLWGGVCERVCRRWERIVRESALVKRRKQAEKWVAYEAGVIKPRVLEGHTGSIYTLAVGLDGKIYSGSHDNSIRVWSGVDGAHLYTLEGHTDAVRALTVGFDGKIYSGSYDRLIRVWSGVDGTHLQTLRGHTNNVLSLAVGLDGRIYSGSEDKTIRVWSGVDGSHLQTLEGHESGVSALTVGLDGRIYSGSRYGRIRVWSGADGVHLQTLDGHSHAVTAVTVGLDGRIYSGSEDATQVWSDVDGSHLWTLTSGVCALAVGLDGKIYSGSSYGAIRVWSSVHGGLLRTVTVDFLNMSTHSRWGGTATYTLVHAKLFKCGNDGVLARRPPLD